MQKTLKVNYKLLPFITKPQPIKVAYGGRGSGKSIGVCDMAIMKMESQRLDVYCLREFQESIKDSIHRTLSMSIDRLGLSGWNVQETKIVSPFGNETTYKGAARNATSIQGAENYLLSIFSEAHTASQESIDRLLPTILRKPGAQCWFEANPQASNDPFSERFINPYKEIIERQGFYEDDLHYIVSVNWRDNPWWNSEQERLRAWDYENLDRAKYDWIWEGAFSDSVEDAIIMPEWFDACVDAHLNPKFNGQWQPKGARICAFDPADTGDAKGFAARIGNVFTDVCDYTKGDSEDGLKWGCDKAIMFGADEFTWDYSGIGSGMLASIRQSMTGKKIKINAFNGAESPENKDSPYISDDGKKKTIGDVFINMRAQRYCRLAQLCYNSYRCIVKGQYIDPSEMISFSSEIKDIQRLRSELCRVPRVKRGDGVFQIMNKKEMLKKGIPSPNMGDSVMMCIYEPKPTIELDLNFTSFY